MIGEIIMGSGLFFPLGALPFSILIITLFYSKKHIDTKETKIFGCLVTSNLIGLILEMLCTPASLIYNSQPLISNFIYKFYLLYLVFWISTFAYYIFSITRNELKLQKERYKIFLLYYVIMAIILSILPLEVVVKNDFKIRYIEGKAVLFTYLLSFVAVVVIVALLIMNFKRMKNKKYIPLFAFLVLGSIAFLIQSNRPELLIMTYIETFICAIMYFTIENPDVKIIDELNKNRLLINQLNEEKSNYLFISSTELKKPLKKIEEISKKSNDVSEIQVLKDNMENISNLTSSLVFQVDKVMDMSSLTDNNIKIFNGMFNLKSLLFKIEKIIKSKMHDNIDFVVNIDQNMPEYIIGDVNSIEQVIVSVLNNSIENTNSGFIELSINSFVKYDMCRIVIVIEDSGKGISIADVNNILNTSLELTDKDKERLEKKDINLKLIRKIINQMGGYFNIKSEVDKGTEVKMVFDTKIDNQINIDKYVNSKSVLVVSNNLPLAKKVSMKLQDLDYVVINSAYKNDVIDRIRMKQKFSYIIIDEKIDNYALELLKELKKDKSFKIPCIVILNKDTEIIKEHFINDGFTDYLLLSDLENEVERLFK